MNNQNVFSYSSMADSKVEDMDFQDGDMEYQNNGPSQSKYLAANLGIHSQIEPSIDDRNGWRHRSLFQDLTQTWLNNFVDFSHTVDQVNVDNLLFLSNKERAVNLYRQV